MTEPQAWPIDNIHRNHDGTYNVTLKGGNLAAWHASADKLAAAGITPPPDPINWEALPYGTVVEGVHDHRFVLGADDEWYAYRGGGRVKPTPPSEYGPYTVVHQPATPSVRDALHTLGLTDNDITEAKAWGLTTESNWVLKVRDAAREAEEHP